VHLDDVMVRRTSWHYYHRDAAEKTDGVAEWMGEFLGWSAAKRAEEIVRHRQMTGCPPLHASASSPPPTRRNDKQPVSMV
jgi:glycerol-3-phosphate dehydrogenase